mgnify:CR=1 FL=1
MGGGVRDLLLGRRPKDFDIGTDAHPYQIKKLFRNCWIIGRRFRLAHVRKKGALVEVATFRGQGEDDDRLQYALEWGFFTRCQWGEFDTALYELERCWGRTPESPSPIGAGSRPARSAMPRLYSAIRRRGSKPRNSRSSPSK